MESTNLQLIAELRCQPDAVEELLRLGAEFAERTRKEEGCLEALFYRANEDEELFVFLAEFRDEEAIEEHLEQSWRQGVLEEWPQILESPPRRITLRRVA